MCKLRSLYLTIQIETETPNPIKIYQKLGSMILWLVYALINCICGIFMNSNFLSIWVRQLILQKALVALRTVCIPVFGFFKLAWNHARAFWFAWKLRYLTHAFFDRQGVTRVLWDFDEAFEEVPFTTTASQGSDTVEERSRQLWDVHRQTEVEGACVRLKELLITSCNSREAHARPAALRL